MTHQYMEIKLKKLEKRVDALEQELSRNMEEIAEVIKSDADAEAKCRMISSILAAPPHYFKEPKGVFKL